MGNSARKTSIATRVRGPSSISGEDDAIDQEFLGLWLGLARLREQVRRTLSPRPANIAAPSAKPPARRKPRSA